MAHIDAQPILWFYFGVTLITLYVQANGAYTCWKIGQILVRSRMGWFFVIGWVLFMIATMQSFPLFLLEQEILAPLLDRYNDVYSVLSALVRPFGYLLLAAGFRGMYRLWRPQL